MSLVRTTVAALAVLALTAAGARPIQIRVVAVPSHAESTAASLQRHLGARSRAFVAREAATLAASGHVSEGAIRQAISSAGLGRLQDADIEALVFLVLAQSADDAEQDLENVMAEVQAQTSAKQALRGTMQKMQSQAAAAAGRGRIRIRYSLDGLKDGGWAARNRRLADQKDALSDLSQQQQLAVQLDQQAYASAMESLSNLLKKIADTNAAIISNMK